MIEQIDNKIKKLLTDQTFDDENSINKLKRAMALYIASPWNGVDKRIMSPNEYDNLHKVNYGYECSDKNKGDDLYKKLCQSHGGNLFEHSQWSAIQIIKWFLDKTDIMDDVNLNSAIIAAFFHDIGKGGDCIHTCTKCESTNSKECELKTNTSNCWLDMYSKNKYEEKGDEYHNIESGDVILGKKNFKITCLVKKENEEISIQKLINDEYAHLKVNYKEIALAAYMHWEFGKLNIPNLQYNATEYIKTFLKFCAHCMVIPNEQLLKMCIAVSCADIAAGTNVRIKDSTYGIKVAEQNFLSKDPWTDFGMDQNYKSHRNNVIEEFQKTMKVY
jgi:hypothetical protein